MSTNGSRALADSLVYPYLNHAASMYEEGYASREDIDNGMRFGCGLPKGPLAVIDELGVDIVRDALAAMHAETGEEMHRPRPVQIGRASLGKECLSGCRSRWSPYH